MARANFIVIGPDMRKNVNTAEYWDGRFATGDWDDDGGRRQTVNYARALLPHVDLPRDFSGTILDFGCALGDAMPVYSEAWPKAKCIGLDHAAAAVEQGRSSYGALAEFVQVDHLTAPRADVIIASHVLEHMDDDLGVARALLERCRDLYIVVPYREEPLFHEHLRAYDEHRFDELGPVRWKVFPKEPVRIDRRHLVDIWAKNLIRPLLGRPRKRIARAIVYHLHAEECAGDG